MKLLFKNTFLMLFLFFCNIAFAKIHIEPYLGYSFTAISSENFSKTLHEKQEGLTKQLASNSSYYHGITPGMRLGYSSLNLAVGLDFTFAFWKSLYKKDQPDFRGQQNLFPVLPGLFVSYKLPLFFRAYSTLIPQASVIVKTQNQSQTCTQSRAMKFGFSYLSLPFLSINMEWMPMLIGGLGNCRFWSHTGSIYGNITF